MGKRLEHDLQMVDFVLTRERNRVITIIDKRVGDLKREEAYTITRYGFAIGYANRIEELESLKKSIGGE